MARTLNKIVSISMATRRNRQNRQNRQNRRKSRRKNRGGGLFDMFPNHRQMKL